jgi:hypothetical protein
MTGCQGLSCVRWVGTPSGETVPPKEEHRTFESESLCLFEEPVMAEEKYSLDHWLDLNA